MTPVPFNIKCDRYEECMARHRDLVVRMDALDDRVRSQGESIASLRAQVAAWAAIGALGGGVLVAIVTKVIVN